MLSRDEVTAAYIHVLGRAPESEDVIAYHRRHESHAHLRRALIESEEFAAHYRQMIEAGGDLPGTDPVLAPVSSIQIETDAATRDALWARVAETWRGLGEEAPHWSVLTFERFRPEAIDGNIEDFAETAAWDMALVDAALARLPDAPALRAGTCFELGCGVGRATRGLSERFSRVVAADVSAPHLDIARRDLADCNSVEWRHIRSMADYKGVGQAQFFYSRIVLQHNPPPVQAAILRAVLSGLAAPGAALFQVVTHIEDYGFEANSYLAAPREGMEMHALPQPALFAILAESGMTPVEIERYSDAVVGDPRYRSHLVLAQKR